MTNAIQITYTVKHGSAIIGEGYSKNRALLSALYNGAPFSEVTKAQDGRDSALIIERQEIERRDIDVIDPLAVMDQLQALIAMIDSGEDYYDSPNGDLYINSPEDDWESGEVYISDTEEEPPTRGETIIKWSGRPRNSA